MVLYESGSVTYGSFQRLRLRSMVKLMRDIWLDDEVITYMFDLILNRDTKASGLKIQHFNPAFFIVIR